MSASAPRKKRVFVSLGVRVTIPVVLLVMTVAVGVYLGLVRQSELTLLRSKELAADMVVKLTSVSILPAVVFGDQQEMQRAVDNLARNPDVSDVELWGFEASALGGGEGLLAEFHRAGAKRLGRPDSAKSGRTRDAEAVDVTEPIISLEGKPVAAIVVRFSTAREAASLRQLSRQISYVSVATALCLALAILMVVHRAVVRPVKRLEAAAELLARGEEHDLRRDRARLADEVVLLADKFAEMADAVRDRERRLNVRNAELKLILDSVEQGFLTARVDGTLLLERSAIVATWAGELGTDATLWSLVEKIDPVAGSWLRSAWEQVASDVLPLEVAIDQLPKRIDREDRHFSLAYHPVVVAEQLQHVVVVMTDITSEVQRQRALAEQHEFAALVDQFVRDRRAFRAFWAEATRLVDKILEEQGSSSELLRRSVHTLKGNARFFGLSRVAALCHELETSMAERDELQLTPRERQELRELWGALRQRIEPLLQGAMVFLEVSEDEYKRLLAAIGAREPYPKIEQLVRGLRRESISDHLERAKGMLEDASARLGKSTPRVEVKSDGLRVPPGPWAPFWSVFSHVLNNAIDHGVESDDARRAVGKALPARIGLSSRAQGDDVVIEVSDDGSGIDWDQVRVIASERGLPAQSMHDLKQALFAEGFSLRQDVTESSGRGVGLAAVKHVVTAMGGRIDVDSSLSVGTTWRFQFPLANLRDAGAEGGDS